MLSKLFKTKIKKETEAKTIDDLDTQNRQTTPDWGVSNFPYEKCKVNNTGIYSHYDGDTEYYFCSLGKEDWMPLSLFLALNNDYVRKFGAAGPVEHILMSVDLMEKVSDRRKTGWSETIMKNHFVDHLEIINRGIVEKEQKIEDLFRDSRLPLLFWKATLAVNPTPSFDPLCDPEGYCEYVKSDVFTSYRKAAKVLHLDLLEKTKKTIAESGIEMSEETLIYAPGYMPVQIAC
jgi:hypothetical protein